MIINIKLVAIIGFMVLIGIIGFSPIQTALASDIYTSTLPTTPSNPPPSTQEPTATTSPTELVAPSSSPVNRATIQNYLPQNSNIGSSNFSTLDHIPFVSTLKNLVAGQTSLSSQTISSLFLLLIIIFFFYLLILFAKRRRRQEEVERQILVAKSSVPQITERATS